VARNRPSASEIDRFLEEVNRRKQQQQERRVAPPPPVQKREVKKTQSLEVKKTKVIQRQRITEPVIQMIPAMEPSPPSPILAPNVAGLPNLQILPPHMAVEAEATFVVQAKTLLKSQQGLKTIFVVNEILGPPRCRNPRGPTRG
jgi:hypothetical protein